MARVAKPGRRASARSAYLKLCKAVGQLVSILYDGVFTDKGETSVPKLTVEGFGTVDVENGKRLVLAIEQDAHVDILHACGGNARCTTCRVEFIEGEPTRMTVAERQVLMAKGAVGVRLSCQMTCDRDMKVRAISRLEGSGRPDPGSRPEPDIHPEPVWTTK